MIAVHLDNISFTYVSEPLFQQLSWEIHDDRVAGLVGPNGCGKSTLIKLVSGELTADSGFTVRKKGLRMGYLAQDPVFNPQNTLWEEMMAGAGELADVEKELAALETRLADPQVYNDEKMLSRTLDRQARLLEEYERLGGARIEGTLRSTLLDLGFTEKDFHLPTSVLSGGQKQLLGLGRLLLNSPDLLLLDEPDNHLDLAGKALLEKTIRNFAGGVVIISHDRYLLDMVADEIVELEDGRLTLYPGNYSEYAFDKNTRLQRQQQLFQIQNREILRLETSAKRLMTWGRVFDNNKFIRRAQNIYKRLERIDRIDRPVLERRRMGLELKGGRGSDKVLELRRLAKTFPLPSGTGENIVLAGIDFTIWHGERVGLVGPNGAGKSLLFRCILEQEVPDSGEVVLGPSVRVGYYAQQHETLDSQRTLIDTVQLAGNFAVQRAMAFLTKFLFTYEQARGRIGNLSGGERSRLQMALLMLSGANFLMLDEPTNNLDIASIEALEDALEDFDGSVLVISHDRYFLDRVAGRILELDGGAVTEYTGNYSDYQNKKDDRQL